LFLGRGSNDAIHKDESTEPCDVLYSSRVGSICWFCIFGFLVNQKSLSFRGTTLHSLFRIERLPYETVRADGTRKTRHAASSLAWLWVVMDSGEKNAWFLKEFVRDFFQAWSWKSLVSVFRLR
jgi:hypothetical protein